MIQSKTEKEFVAIIDDPVSSHDSAKMFYISSLIKTLLKDVKENKGKIKQIFILTHNIYFYTEVTHHCPPKDRSFWVLTNRGNESTIKRHENNPIQSSYKRLWDEVKKVKEASDDASEITFTIGNILRRIIEYYFKILGDMKDQDVVDQLKEGEQIIAKGLLSWLHSESHCIEDLHVDSNISISHYLGVFKQIFINSGHGAHYNMMMKEDNSEEASN